MQQSKNLITKTAEAPARSLAMGILATQVVAQKMATDFPNNAVVRKTKGYWHMLGPGLTTGASDDDPSGIAVYSQTGAQTGFHFLWLSIWTFPLMAVVQEMCARIGIVTGKGLAGNIRTHFQRRVLYSCTAQLYL